MNDNYSDMLHLPHQKSKKRPHVPISHRAAQFAPFAALTGHDRAIREVARLTTDKVELDQCSLDRLNEKLQLLRMNLPHQPVVSIAHFQQDEKKLGGAYLTTKGIVKKIDDYQNLIVMTSGTVISITDIFDIECHELFCYYEGL